MALKKYVIISLSTSAMFASNFKISHFNNMKLIIFLFSAGISLLPKQTCKQEAFAVLFFLLNEKRPRETFHHGIMFCIKKAKRKAYLKRLEATI